MAETPKTVLPRRLAGKASSATEANRYSSGSNIPDRDQLTVVDGETVRNLRQTNRIVEAIRLACRFDGTLSTAIYDLVQVANSGLQLKAYNSQTHEFDPEGTKVSRSVLSLMDTVYDYTKGFVDRRSVDSLLETALREVVVTGAISGELVLNKARFPDKIQLVPFETLAWRSRGDGSKFPVQRGVGTSDIPLDIPNFWVIESHLGADSPYPRSMMEAGLSTTFYYAEFIEDMRRAVRRTGHSRMVAQINAERVRAAAPKEAQDSEQKMQAYMESVRQELQSVISAMEPEDALVVYDVADVKDLTSRGEKSDYSELMQTLAGMAATSLKSHPSILGLRIEGSQSLSNTESLVFLQVARAAQKAVATFFSRALTLATRLYGVDSYVKCRFAPVNLRPEDELEAFKTMRQTRVLEQLSLGLISDGEAQEELGLPPKPAGSPLLSGTMFMAPNNTRANEVSPNTDPMGRALQPDTPNNGGGRSQ
jgi:hypothetical protein